MDPQKTRTDSAAGVGSRIKDAWDEGPEPHRAPADAFGELGTHLAELREYAAYFLAAKADAIKASFRNLGLYAALGIVGLLAGGALIVTAAVLLLTGLAGAIGAMFDPDRPWVGNIAVGLLVLGGIATGTMLVMKKLTRASRERTIRKYESRKQQQRVRYGHDVHERAAEAREQA